MNADALKFVEACGEEFGFLCERYGFSAPWHQALGCETYVHFERGLHQVSISYYDPGGRPMIELFYPCTETGESPTPRAEREGTPRAARYPRMHVDEPFVCDPEGMRAFLRALAVAFERAERGWLSI